MRDERLDGARDRGKVDVQPEADRWSTGKVLLYLLDRFGEEDTVLRATASTKLTAYNPDRRPSMLHVASLLSDVVNVAIATAS